jgi:hypothetical protein
MKVNVHNQCSDFNLVDQKHFNYCAGWDEHHVEKVDASNMMSIDLKPLMAAFEGALICKLQKNIIKSDDQLESPYLLFFIAWKSGGYKKYHVVLKLIECDKTFHWDKFKPEEYFQKHANQFSTYTGPIKETWLINDNTVLMTKLEIDFTKRDGALNITISDSSRDEHTKLPEWINLGR